MKYLKKEEVDEINNFINGNVNSEIEQLINNLPEQQKKKILAMRERQVFINKSKNNIFGQPDEIEEILQSIPDKTVSDKLSDFIYGVYEMNEVQHELNLVEIFRDDILEAREYFLQTKNFKIKKK
jgi:hypothetical protein